MDSRNPRPPNPQRAMQTNWWGLIGEKLHKLTGRVVKTQPVGGTPGSGENVPYSVTEEFVSLYRLHPWIPGEFLYLSPNLPISLSPKGEELTMIERQNCLLRWQIRISPQEITHDRSTSHFRAPQMQSIPKPRSETLFTPSASNTRAQ
jgi:hypothetical protein